MKNESQWLFHSKANKMPMLYDLIHGGFYPRYTSEEIAKSHNCKVFTPNDLMTYDQAIQYTNDKYGVSYYLKGAKYAFIDIDNAFIEGTTDLRFFFKRVVDFVTSKNSAVYYSLSGKGLHIPVLRTENLAYTSNELRNFSNKDIEYKEKVPKIEYFTDTTRHMAFTNKSYNSLYDNTITETDIIKMYNIFRKKIPIKPINTSKSINTNFKGTDRDIVNNNIPIENVLSDFCNYHESLSITQRAWCPLHEGKQTSLKLSRTPNRLICFGGCSKDGNIHRLIDNISIVQQVCNVDCGEAIKILRDRYLPTYKLEREKGVIEREFGGVL